MSEETSAAVMLDTVTQWRLMLKMAKEQLIEEASGESYPEYVSAKMATMISFAKAAIKVNPAFGDTTITFRHASGENITLTLGVELSSDEDGNDESA